MTRNNFSKILKKIPVKELTFSNAGSLQQKQNPSKVFFKDFAYSGTPTVNFYVKAHPSTSLPTH